MPRNTAAIRPPPRDAVATGPHARPSDVGGNQAVTTAVTAGHPDARMNRMKNHNIANVSRVRANDMNRLITTMSASDN